MNRSSLLCAPALIAAVALSGCGEEHEALEETQGAVIQPCSSTAYGSNFKGVLAYHGGSGGTTCFDDPATTTDRIQSFRIWSGSIVDAIQMTYYDPATGTYNQHPKRGGGGGYYNPELLLNSGDYIYSTEGRSAASVDQLCVRAYYSQVQKCSSTAGGGNQWLEEHTPYPYQVQGAWTQSGQYLDAIRLRYFTPR